MFDPANIPFVVEVLIRPGANFPEVHTLVGQDPRRTGHHLHDALADLETPAPILSGLQDVQGLRAPLSLEAAIPGASPVWLEQFAQYPRLDAPMPTSRRSTAFSTEVTAAEAQSSWSSESADATEAQGTNLKF